jgi:SAM-dependent methyltransferase
MTERERFLRDFHAARPAATSRALARSGIYERFAERVRGEWVLDLACGDGHLTPRLGPRAMGIDFSPERGPTVRARAQELSFADATFDAVACHLAFMLFDDIELVVAELARVLRSGGTFHALLGGGPTAHGDDAFHALATLLPRAGIAFGDARSKSEAGWRELFGDRDWRDITFERWEIDLGGNFDEVWAFLGSSYQLAAADHERVRAELRARFFGERVPCAAATYYARDQGLPAGWRLVHRHER